MRLPWNNGDGDSNSSRVYRDIDLRLRSLPFSDFQQIVLMWISAKGYSHIKSLGRRFKRGRRQTGGADFVAILPNTNLETVIQIRHWATPVSKRAVDELRGFMQRNLIPIGIIFTSSSFSASAILTAMQYPGRPIRFYSRNRLSAWLACSGLAVRKVGLREEVDEGFFRVLSSLRLASALSLGSKHPTTDGQKDLLSHYLDIKKKSRLKVIMAVLLPVFVLLVFGFYIKLGGTR